MKNKIIAIMKQRKYLDHGMISECNIPEIADEIVKLMEEHTKYYANEASQAARKDN